MNRQCLVGAALAALWVAPLSAQAPTGAPPDSVAVGYGRVRAGDLTGAVTEVRAAQFDAGRVVSPEQLIQGKVAGVQVAGDNQPGGVFTVRIRGAASIVAGGDPLYVVDGVPLGFGAGGGLITGRDPLNFLNPGDIASITVLRDGASAAIYGGNGSNGVVLITTRSANAGGRRGTEVEYGTSASSSSVTRLPAVLSATQFAGAVATYAPARESLLGGASTDWFGLLDRAAFGQAQDVSVTNTGETGSYRLSLGYLSQGGAIRGSSTDRLSLGFNYDQRLFGDRLGIRASVRGARTHDQLQAADVLGNAVAMAPTQPVYDPASPTGYWDWPTVGASASNPLASLERSTDVGTSWRSVGNVRADYRLPFLEALRINLDLGYDVTQAARSTFIPNDLADQIRQGQGFLSLANNSRTNQLIEAYLDYAAPLTLLPGRVAVTAGWSYAKSHSEYPYFQETGLSSNLLGVDGVPTAASVENAKSVFDGELTSLFGRLEYNFADRYLATLSVRRDRSTSFGPGHQWAAFPALALAWRVSGEPFLRSLKAVSDLKLRVSWGTTGNQGLPYQLAGVVGLGATVDPNLTWERTHSSDVGFDYGFFGQRISGSFDWYTRKTTDLIFAMPVAIGVGFSNYVTTNVGTVRNQGVELSLSARILEARHGGLGWTADFTLSHNANTLLGFNPNLALGAISVGAISGGVGSTIQVLTPGQPRNAFLVCRQYYQNGKPVENTYLPLVQNAAGDSTVTGCSGADLRPYKSPWPTLELGHTSRLTYGRFDFSFTLRAELGNYVYDNVAAANGSYQNITAGNVTPSNMSASVLATGFTAPQYLSDYYVQDGSFLRMDNLTLGYAFSFGGRQLRLYATVQNAFTITGYGGVDPAASPSGIENNAYPPTRTVTCGLTVRF